MSADTDRGAWEREGSACGREAWEFFKGYSDEIATAAEGSIALVPIIFVLWLLSLPFVMTYWAVRLR